MATNVCTCLVQIALRYRHTFSVHVDFPVERIKYQQFLYQITQAFGWLITESFGIP